MIKTGSKFFAIVTGMLLLLANITSASACTFSQYQPEVPKSLRK